MAPGEDDILDPRFLADRRLPPRFERRTITLDPGHTRGYEESEWRDAIVVVKHGVVELQDVDDNRRRFARGDILWLDGLSIEALHNPGAEPTVLVSVSRRASGDEQPPT